MAYSVVKGKTSLEIPPEEEAFSERSDDVPDPNAVSVPLGDRCPHGYYTHHQCYVCNPKKYLPVTRDNSLNDDVFPWSPLKVGGKVCRKIRPNEIGTITSITYVFTDSHHMREIWVDFCEAGRSTPYQPLELLSLKVQ